VANTRKIGRHDVPETPWISPKVAVGPSPERGNGLFAAEPISVGEVVLVWGGDSYTDEASAARARAEGRGTMQWDEDLFSREGIGDHDAFAINHSCDPNAWLEGVFTVTARRAIAPGDELAVDYATVIDEEDYIAEWACRCGSPDCRGRVTGEDWKIAVLRANYAGHFTPLLNGKIADYS
jgi:hypothetical protein